MTQTKSQIYADFLFGLRSLYLGTDFTDYAVLNLCKSKIKP